MANPNPSLATRFKPGNRMGGRRPLPITRALAACLTEPEATILAELIKARALAGDPWFIQFLADRLEGKAVARAENGEPGEFAHTIQQVRRAIGLKAVP